MSTTFALMPSVPAKSFDAATVTASVGTSYALLANACLVTWQTSFAVAPVAINIIIETSLDDSVWSTVATTTAVGGATDSFVTSALFIRASIVSHNAGTGATVILVAKTAMLSTGQTLIGNITEGQIAFGSATANTLEGNAALTWDNTIQKLAFTNPDVVGGPLPAQIFQDSEGFLKLGTFDGGGIQISETDVTVQIGGDLIIAEANKIKTEPITGRSMSLQGYDADGAAYVTFVTITNSNTPDMTIAPPAGSTVNIQASGYKSSDGSAGATTTITTASLVGKTITVKNGLITGFA